MNEIYAISKEIGLTSMLASYLVNLLSVWMLVNHTYSKLRPSATEYRFGFLVVNTIVFFICFLFVRTDMSIGVALGLFTIFTIVRYRTESLPILEMTFLFTAVGIGFINALGAIKLQLIMVLIANIIIVLLTLTLFFFILRNRVQQISIKYERLDLLLPKHKKKLHEDLCLRLGVRRIKNVIVTKTNPSKGKAKLNVFFVDQPSQFL